MAHNLKLNLATQLGLVGLALALLVALTAAFRIFPKARHSDFLYDGMLAGLFGMLLRAQSTTRFLER